MVWSCNFIDIHIDLKLLYLSLEAQLVVLACKFIDFHVDLQVIYLSLEGTLMVCGMELHGVSLDLMQHCVILLTKNMVWACNVICQNVVQTYRFSTYISLKYTSKPAMFMPTLVKL